MDQTTQQQTTRLQAAEHALSRFGHWILLAMTAATVALQKIAPMAADLHNDIQMAMLVLGGTTVAAILHSAMVQKALVATQAAAKGAEVLQQAASSVSNAIQSAITQVPKS